MNENSEVIREAHRLSETRLEWQFTSAIAADQRAMGVAGMLIGAAAILAAIADSTTNTLGVFVGSAGLGVAAFLAWYSARPVKFYAPGAAYSDLEPDIEDGVPIDEVLGVLGRFHDKHAKTNDDAMQRSSRLMKASFAVALASVALTIAIQLICVN